MQGPDGPAAVPEPNLIQRGAASDQDEDMDFFDDEGYEEEPYINEDDEPQIAEDAETDGDED